MAGIGDCEKCHGPLCVARKQVCCERCGHVHADHELTRGWLENEAKAIAPPAPVIPPMDYASTIPDRVKRLEERLASLERQYVHGSMRAEAQTQVATHEGRRGGKRGE